MPWKKTEGKLPRCKIGEEDIKIVSMCVIKVLIF